MSKMIYADNAATTQVSQRVLQKMLPWLGQHYGNPSSIYGIGREARAAIEEARSQVAQAIGANPGEIYFTSCGTESDNWAIKGLAHTLAAKGKRHIITSAIEHHAVLHTCKALEKEGFSVTYLPVDQYGLVSPAQVEKAITPQTALVSIMFANNEIGTIQPIREIGQIAREHGILFHTDAVQAFGQLPMNVDELNIDMLRASAHKLNGPKGIGFLYIRKGVKIRNFIHGGAQERKRRAGTENVPGIAGFGEAVREIYTDFEEKRERLYRLKEQFVEGIGKLNGASVNGKTGRDSAPHIVSAGFEGVKSEVLLHALEERGIYVSSGSACASNHPAVSGTLKAMGVRRELLDSTLRFSFSEFTTEEELACCLKALEELLPVLRRFQRH